MTRPRPHPALRLALLPLVFCALAGIARAAEPPATPGASSVEDIVISAQKFNRRTLEHEIVPQFVKTHSAPTPLIEQIARWHQAICPEVQGLEPDLATLVSGRIYAAAQSVGAPNAGAGHTCKTNVIIVFTNEPQKLVDSIAKSNSSLLGSGRTRGDTVFSHTIQVWYMTGTRQLYGSSKLPVQGMQPPPVQGGQLKRGMGVPKNRELNTGGAAEINPGAAPPETDSAVTPDPVWGTAGAPGGLAGSRLGAGLRSELLRVTIIVDMRMLEESDLPSVSDYIAFLALTRVASLDACSRLPSIIDLYSKDCTEHAKPSTWSAADGAFLKALYASSLEGKLGIEQSEIDDDMIAALQQPR